MAKHEKRSERKTTAAALLKRCTRCRKTKALTEFSHDRSRGDGVGAKCKKCESECAKLRDERLRDRPPDEMPKVTAKRCSKCGKVKLITNFHVSRRNRDGYTCACKLCNQRQKQSYYERLAARRESEIPPVNAKRCPKCGETKPVSEFHKAASKASGYATLCRDCACIGAAERRNRVADRDFTDIQVTGKKRCWMCGRNLLGSEFNYCRSAPDGLASHCRECDKEYKQQHYEENYGDYYDRQCQYRREYPEKRRAFAIVSDAIKRGQLTRPEICSRCGESGTIVAHHDDYQRRLEIQWLCLRCDRQLHADLKRKEKGRSLT